MQIYYINYDAIPGPDSPDFETTGGASINCWIKAASAEDAQIISNRSITEQKWRITKMTTCRLDTASNYEAKPRSLEYFTQAEMDGECYVFHEWPNEPQSEDLIN